MGNVHMEATQVNYREGNKKMSVAEAIKNAGSEITPEEKAWIDTIPELASQEIIAPEFDAESGIYAIGDLVMHEGKLYEFTSAHETAGDWNSEEVSEKTVADEVGDVKSGLTNVENELNGDVTVYPYADVITIEDAVPANLAGCSVKIEPVQSGTGTPSPDNVRPITGHTEASVTVTDDAENPTVTKTYTIALGDTIYGGTVDFDSGVMTVDRAYVEFDGSDDESWTEYIGSNYRQYSLTISGSVDKSYVCNILPSIIVDERETKSGVAYKTSGFDSLLRVCLLDGDGYNIASVADFKAFLAVNNMQLIYDLATPTAIQLTPQQIQLLKGTNTLTASTGQISVTVNGVSGAIGSVQEQVNEIVADLAEQLPDAPTTDGAYTLTVTVADGTPTYSWVSGS